jgi:predicted aspartyl protease
MAKLQNFLKKKGYKKIKLEYTKTKHFRVSATLNGIQGDFIIDTGASNTCIGFDQKKHFNLTAEDSPIKAAGAGAINMDTEISHNIKLEIGKWKSKKIDVVIFDLKHVNEALVQHEAQPVHGIIGADILNKSNAIIDYKKHLIYLK